MTAFGVPSSLTQPASVGGGPADAALGSIFGSMGSFLNPVAGVAGLLAPALAGAPSSASGQADSGAPVTFAPVQIGTGNTANPAVSNSDTQSTTQVPIQPSTGVYPQYSVPPSSGVEGSSPSGPSPLVLGAAGSAVLAAAWLLLR